MDCPLRILHLEDDASDSALVQETLEAGGFHSEITRVDTQRGFCASLDQVAFDLIFADNTLPSFDGLSALRLARSDARGAVHLHLRDAGRRSCHRVAEDRGDRLHHQNEMSRIVPSVRRALREAEDRARRAEAEKALRRSES
jgi:CheY-like chemotaxis protein